MPFGYQKKTQDLDSGPGSLTLHHTEGIQYSLGFSSDAGKLQKEEKKKERSLAMAVAEGWAPEGQGGGVSMQQSPLLKRVQGLL